MRGMAVYTCLDTGEVLRQEYVENVNYKGTYRAMWYMETNDHVWKRVLYRLYVGDEVTSEEYYDHGVLHRIDGPAYRSKERGKLVERWYCNGTRCWSFQDFKNRSGISDKEAALLKLKYCTMDSDVF